MKKLVVNRALSAAALVGHDDSLNELLKAGADVNVCPIISTPLEEAAQRGFDKFVKLLLEAGADVNMR